MITLVDTISRLIFAFIIGSVIGFERERKGGVAGLRTHILVCVGSALIMLVSLYIYDIYKGVVPLDPGRIAAGVVTGIGFLGAGSIIRSSEGIRGLTTAASLWMSGALGLAVGCGYISAAVVTTLLTYLCLSFLKRVDQWLEKEEKE